MGVLFCIMLLWSKVVRGAWSLCLELIFRLFQTVSGNSAFLRVHMNSQIVLCSMLFANSGNWRLLLGSRDWTGYLLHAGQHYPPTCKFYIITTVIHFISLSHYIPPVSNSWPTGMSLHSTFCSMLQVYSWVAIIVLPINSVINPILYTMSTETYRSQLRSFLQNQIQRIRDVLNRYLGCGRETTDELEMM